MKIVRRYANRLEKLILQCVRAETKPHWSSLWGQKCFIHPADCGVVEGNGKQIVFLKTGDSRPNYYILLIDSSHDLKSDDFDVEILLSGVEEIFGNHDDFEQQYFGNELKVREKYADEHEPWLPYEVSLFPRLSTGNGYWWGSVKNFGTIL